MFTKTEKQAFLISLAVAGGITLAGSCLALALPHSAPRGGLVFLLLANDADGAQHVRAAVPMPGADCLPLQRAIWAEPSPVAYTDSDGRAVPALDAACVPADQWAGELARGAQIESR
jgi:hypothetical protein